MFLKTSKFVIFIALLISAAIFWFFTNRMLSLSRSAFINKNSTAPTRAIKVKNELITEIPVLFPKVSWSVFHPDEKQESLGKYGLSVQGKKYITLSMSGQQWYSSNENLSRQQMDTLKQEFEEYYSNQLAQRGWETSAKIQDYDISPFSADGPGGSIHGYIALKNNSIREILLQEVSPIEDFGGKATCPCSLGFNVLVSNPIQEDTLLKNIENTKE